MTEYKKRILLITPFAPPSIGGAETHLEDLYEYLSKDGYYVYVLTYQPITVNLRGQPREKRLNLEIRRYTWFGHNLFFKFESYPPIFNFLYLTPYLMLRSFLFMLIHKDQVDIIHAFGLSSAFVARVLKMFFGKKIIMSTEALYGFKRGKPFSLACRWVLEKFDKILAHSKDSKDELVRIGLPEDNIIIFTHWVNQDNFKPGNKGDLKRKLGWENKFTVLYLGRLIPQKGIGVFIDIARRTRKDIAFKVIGDDGPELPKVREAERRLKNFDYIGKVAYKKLPPYYAAADVFVYPALYEEDVSRALLESLSSGTPVINTNRGSGIYKLDESVGFVTRPTARDIQEKIEFLYDHPEKLLAITKNCPIFAEKFGPKLAKIITNVYNQVSPDTV